MGFQKQGSPVRAKDLSCLQHSFAGPFFNGGFTPACSLFSLSGLGMDEQLFSASAIFCCHWGSTFSGQVSAIEARDEAIFTRIKRLIA
jgi:hypothetical protein